MNKQQEFLVRACAELDLEISIGDSIEISSGAFVYPLAHIKDVGGKRGTVIFSTFDNIGVPTSDLIDSGYSYSVYSSPAAEEEFDLDSYLEMFVDWGWAGSEEKKPSWMR